MDSIVWILDLYGLKTNIKKCKASTVSSFYEVVSAFDDPNGYEIPDSTVYEDRWVLVGMTASGRVLAIVFSDEDVPIYRLITAFDAEGKLLDEYYRRRGI